MNTDSIAPAAPRRWPVCDLVPVKMTSSVASPSAARTDWASVTSPAGVEVACALTCLMSEGCRPASRTASRTAVDWPMPSGSGATMSYASELIPAPASVP